MGQKFAFTTPLFDVQYYGNSVKNNPTEKLAVSLKIEMALKKWLTIVVAGSPLVSRDKIYEMIVLRKYNGNF